MSDKIFEFNSRKEKYIFLGIFVILIFLLSTIFYPGIKAYIMGDAQPIIQEQTIEISQTGYYGMFQCSCCGRSIDANCCGMAKQRKAYVDELLLDGVEENELVYKMVKKFGFDVLMDQSKEQEVRDYIMDQAPENPAQIEIEPSSYDFGTISQADGIISTEFTIKNTGKSDLVIENIDTSCMCTSASIIYDGVESSTFGMSMHGTNPKNFALSIPSGKTAVLKVFYDPMAHGIQKKQSTTIVRTVTLVSNDPNDFQKKATIRLTQLQ